MVEEALVSAVVEQVDPDEVLRLARRLVATPSENPGGTEDAVAGVAVGILEELGGAPEIVRGEEGRPSVVARFGNGDRPALAWNGHLDVVPAGDPSTWRHPPFGAEVVDGSLIGRGAADMKGPIASALGAVSAIRRSGVELGGRLDLHLAADEELAGLHGTKVLLEHGLLDQDAAIVGEPTELNLALAERGGAWITATARGTAAHGSTPQLGVSAITSMARFLLRIEEVLPDLEHPLVGRPTVNAAIDPGWERTQRRRGPLRRRDRPADHPGRDRAREGARAVRPARGRDPRRTPGGRPVVRDPHVDRRGGDHPPTPTIADLCRAAVRTETGRRARLDTGFTGITDARFYLNDRSIPTIILGPGSLGVAHMANESVEVAELVTAARVYARVFVGFLGGS